MKQGRRYKGFYIVIRVYDGGNISLSRFLCSYPLSRFLSLDSLYFLPWSFFLLLPFFLSFWLWFFSFFFISFSLFLFFFGFFISFLFFNRLSNFWNLYVWKTWKNHDILYFYLCFWFYFLLKTIVKIVDFLKIWKCIYLFY